MRQREAVWPSTAVAMCVCVCALADLASSQAAGGRRPAPRPRWAAAGQSAAGLRWTCGSWAGRCEVGLWASPRRLLLEGRMNHCPREEEGAVNKVPFGWAWTPGSPSVVRELLGPSQGNRAPPAAPWPWLAELHSAARRAGEAGWATHTSKAPTFACLPGPALCVSWGLQPGVSPCWSSGQV